jgi:hypothetical protein
MNVLFKMTTILWQEVHARLSEPHEFAAERVGFLKCQLGTSRIGLIVLAHSLHEVEDKDYLDDPSAGATMGPAAIRKALAVSYNEKVSMFHVHLHMHRGRPRFRQTDFRESAFFVPDFWNVQPGLPHGAIVLSADSAWGRCWYPGKAEPIDVEDFSIVGTSMRQTWKK